MTAVAPVRHALSAFAPSCTRGEALARLREAFGEAGIESPGLDARLLAEAALGIGAAALLAHPEVALGRDGASSLGALAERRLAREPVARILGIREFWGLPFRLSPATLEPRQDTETVVEAALAALPDRDSPLRLLDLGTGTGCILVAILSERPNARGLGTDRSAAALATARANAVRNGVGARADFAASDWAAALGGRFDLVVSNPPYIARPDLAGLAPEVARHDPAAALDGGPDGLAAYRAILSCLPRLLAPGGVALLEIGHDQADALVSLAGDRALAVRRVIRDLGGRDRAVLLAQA